MEGTNKTKNNTNTDAIPRTIEPAADLKQTLELILGLQSSQLQSNAGSTASAATKWMIVRLIIVASGQVGVSVWIHQIPPPLLEARYLVAWVNANGVVWRQNFTVLKNKNVKNVVHLLAVGAGGRILKELYKSGVRYILIGDLEPAP